MVKVQKQKFGKRVHKGQRAILILLMFVVGVIIGVGSMKNSERADGITLACRKSAECMAAVAAEEQAAAAASAASASANYYQAKVAELNREIASMQLQIADTQAQIEDLNVQIDTAEKKLTSEQSALAELLINMHFEGDAEPITILAGASSISDLAEKAARSDVAKQQISAVAVSIKNTKQKLEEDKVKVEELLAQQKQAKEDLEATKQEQQQLVAKYQNDAAQYQADVLAAREAQRIAAEKYRQEHASEFTYYEGENTYQWQGECPAKFRNSSSYITYVDGYKVGGQICECVSYVGWKAYEWYGVYLGYGNAYDWAWKAKNAGYNVDHNPAVGSIGQTIYGEYGHVFWVEQVNSDGSINVSEYNFGVDGKFGSRKIKASAARQYNYIHLEQKHQI